jgi:tight adherence protein C
MNISVFWNSLTLQDMLALSGILGVIVGGAALITSGIPKRGELLARRVGLAIPQTAKAEGARRANPLDLLHVPSLGAGLSEAETRRVISLFSKFNVPAGRAASYFVVGRLITAGVMGGLALEAARGIPAFDASMLLPILVAIAVAIAGWILPSLLVARMVKRRMKAVAAGLPSALELLVVCVEAGLSLEDSFQRVARELKQSQPALSEELSLTWAELNLLPNRNQAFLNLADRVNVPSVRSVVGMLTQGMRFGTPLGQSLRVGAVEMRNEQMMRMEEKASRLPALMTIPVMLFIMPTIFLIVGGPAALKLMDTFRGGIH